MINHGVNDQIRTKKVEERHGSISWDNLILFHLEHTEANIDFKNSTNFILRTFDEK